MRIRPTILGMVVLCLAGTPRTVAAYSVLTHEAIVDTAWDTDIRPMLVKRFRASARDLQHARAFAYGGCIVHDMGYYPLASRFFGDLAHYVRSGDFVMAMIRDAQNPDELAFALGALAHYTADNYGHPIAINPATPMLFPKLAAEYGPVVTYEDKPSAHLRTEFAFDVVQVARGNYLPESYRDFIGFQVAVPLLERAFKATYGLALRDVFGNLDAAVGTFRWSVGTVLPALTKAAWASKQSEVTRLRPDITRETFLFTYSRGDYEQAWGKDYRRPGMGSRILAFLIRVAPKIGPFKALAFTAPTPEAERLFLASFKTVVQEYRRRLVAVSARDFTLDDRNFDTGKPVHAGEYRLVDQTYAELVSRLAKHDFADLTPELRRRVIAFYADRDKVAAPRRASSSDRKLAAQIAALKAARPAAGRVKRL